MSTSDKAHIPIRISSPTPSAPLSVSNAPLDLPDSEEQ